MKYYDLDFFAPEGLQLNNEDAFRKFGGCYVLGRIKNDDKEDTITPIRIEGLIDPVVSYSTPSGTYRGLKNYIRLAAPFPISGASNYKNGVLRCYRDGTRQWLYGVGGEGLKVFQEEVESTPLYHFSWDMIAALYSPSYSHFKEAFDLLNSKDSKQHAKALNPRYWLKRVAVSAKTSQVVLYRKDIPIGAFMSNDPSSLYLNQSCLAVSDELKYIMEL